MKITPELLKQLGDIKEEPFTPEDLLDDNPIEQRTEAITTLIPMEPTPDSSLTNESTEDSQNLVREESTIDNEIVEESNLDKNEESIHHINLSNLDTNEVSRFETKESINYINLKETVPYHYKDKNHSFFKQVFEKKWIKIVVGIFVTILFTTTLVFGLSYLQRLVAPATDEPKVTETTTVTSVLTPEAVAELNKTAEAEIKQEPVPQLTHQQKMEQYALSRVDTSLPNSITYDKIGGDYTLITITYHPDDKDKSYKDMVIYAPETKVDGSIDLSQKRIDELDKFLKDKGTKLESNVQVPDVLALRWEHYAMDNHDISILFYKDIPFGYYKHEGSKHVLVVVTAYLESVKQ